MDTDIEEMWEIRRYTPDKKREWNEFVENSRNSTFLFMREYMEYHSHRFADHSLMAYRLGRLSALLPANLTRTTLHSHQGLTYGGWIWPSAGPDTTDIFLLWKKWMEYCDSVGIKKIVYKPLPYIYALRPSDEDRYMLFLSKAKLRRCDISTAINLKENPGFNKLQKRHLKHKPENYRTGVTTASDPKGIEDFFNMLHACLEERHGATPVHDTEEMSRLMSFFPEEILIWAAYVGEQLHGGICAYVTRTCLHCQYIATTPEGREKNVLAPLIEEMINFYYDSGCTYFDFGISNENDGWLLNRGLNRQKTSFGGSGVAYQKYEINVSSALKSLPTELWPAK